MVMPASHKGWSLRPSYSVLIQFPVNMPGEAVDDPSAWISAPTHVGNPEDAPDCCLLPGPAMAISSIWGMTSGQKREIEIEKAELCPSLTYKGQVMI